ncbi:MAG: 50S ribosomal protein L27 [uncultured bacterium]|uniref:Large ribosomal subunit protein bL27 n=4 Tax=Candidatus Daviesiibacteriota TaxID=1752718 RepID=A0A0G0ERS3_9BACT|nr:MAG: 50S ribosomal protein L27 [uncultured bacterium]KKQ08177.1 MAG: 50S ribosomal protein L27 [Candidatus Daviesbacteria bacterium GW2011_GWB1_36_5]KKQ15639.1 MAG: 50S ribosomal protein L27 [Candidatus Daviesbacteria bacterium GW2011_GWA1_36_8]OGE17502.1 MAG: 50S ribosomal protein L27 [Candidatus Daviesbacteria bacterium RIFCSPHIGHO2_01_FULL_36_37]OGE36597.1 MAG: 50S ribosomal protein L27 [Candidatus Daviesbacteria bacterium RIFCSPHIGHO2_12_FULL_37_16]
MAHKKGGGTAKTNRDSISKRLGVKKYGGEKVLPGNIIIRQKGSKFHTGVGVRMGNDFTIYSVTEGKVEFKKKLGKRMVHVT